MHQVRLVIHGRVQGVGFRYFVLRRAQELRLSGQVCNRSDGAVEIEAFGEMDDLERLRDAVRRGPPGARVTAVDESWGEGRAARGAFRIAP